MPVYAWLSAVFCAGALVGSTAWAVVRALRTWRGVRSFTRATGTALDGVLATAASAETHALSLTDGGERLARATAHLQESLARAAVIRSALGETQQLLRRLRGAVPHK